MIANGHFHIYFEHVWLKILTLLPARMCYYVNENVFMDGLICKSLSYFIGAYLRSANLVKK